MTSHMKPLPFLNLASSTTLAPDNRATVPAAIKPPASGGDHEFAPLTSDESDASHGEPAPSTTPANEDQILRTRLFVIDMVAVLAGWVALGFALVPAPNT